MRFQFSKASMNYFGMQIKSSEYKNIFHILILEIKVVYACLIQIDGRGTVLIKCHM